MLRYFHNAGYFELSGDDFDGLFAAGPLPRTWRRCGSASPGAPPVARSDRTWPTSLGTGSPGTWRGVRPRTRSGCSRPRSRSGCPRSSRGRARTSTAYAFHNPRLVGASMELLATHVRWLFGAPGEEAAARLDDVVGGAKMLLFRLARQRSFDVAAVVAPMADAYDDAVARLDDLAR